MQRISDIDLRLLRVFVAVSDAGGYAAAEPVLNVTTSTISIHISDLEKRLGFRLCERGRSGFRLTHRGRIVYEETIRLLKTLDDFTGTLAAARDTLAGRLVLGTVDCLVTHPDFPVTRAIRRFNALENTVDFELVTDSRQELERAALDGRIHAAIGPFVRSVSGLHFLPLFKERHSVYCGPEHPFFGLAPKQQAKRALPVEWVVLRAYQEAFDRERFGTTKARALVTGMEAMLTMLRSGSYIGYLPDHFAKSWVDKNQLFRIERPDLGYISEHMLITRQAGRETEPLRVFTEFLIEEAHGRAEPAA